jgi:hypothetical protein
VTIEVNHERFRLWSTNTHFIAESKRRMGSGKSGTALFSALADGTDCDGQWSFHVDPKEMSWPGVTIEVCDGRPSDVEHDKARWFHDVKRWCPWSTTVVAVDEKPAAATVAAIAASTPVVLSGTPTYSADTYINATELQVADNTSITIRGGKTLTIVANSVTWGSNVTLNATGVAGTQPSATPGGKGDWTSSPRCHSHFPAHNCGAAGSAHQVWKDAIEDTKAGRNHDRGEPGYTGNPGGTGGTGGALRLFLDLDASPDGPLKSVSALGGAGGPGGRGGPGKDLKCGDHGGEHWAMEGPAGSQGPAGHDGRIEVHVTGTNAGLFVTKVNEVSKPAPAAVESLTQTDWDAAAARERGAHPSTPASASAR